MNPLFREVEASFEVLRRRFREQEISRREFIDQLKKLRLKDDRGRFWMIGAQTGKWYYFDGKEWVPAEPPPEQVKKVKCYRCGLENEEGTDLCERCGESLKETEASCPKCGTKLESPFQVCPACSQVSAISPYAEEALFKGKAKKPENFVLRRLDPVSVLFLSGGTGVVGGIILGAFAGVSGNFSGLARSLPDFLGTLHGTLMGGIIFAGLAGILGFVLAGLLGYLQALLFNAISSIVGGVGVNLERAEKTPEEKKNP